MVCKMGCCMKKVENHPSNSMLLWWTLDSVLLSLVIKPKDAKEALQWSGGRKCKVTSIKPN